MAINYKDPYNQGLGTPNLGNMNLGQVPVNNMQVAEAINYNTLPGATETFTPSWPMGSSMNFGVKEWLGNNPNPTKADFVEGLQSGQFGGATTGAFSKNVDELFKGTDLDAGLFSTEFGDVNPEFMSPGTGFGGYIDINKSKLSKDALEALPEKFWKGDDQASLDNDFYNEYGYPKTAGLINPITKKMWDMVRIYNAAKKIKKHGPKVLKTIGTLTGGGVKAAPAKPTWHVGPDTPSSTGVGGAQLGSGMTTGQHAAFRMAQGGRASYFDGGLLSLWPR